MAAINNRADTPKRAGLISRPSGNGAGLGLVVTVARLTPGSAVLFKVIPWSLWLRNKLLLALPGCTELIGVPPDASWPAG